MGQTLSVEFRGSVTRMLKRPVKASDADHWKALFMTKLDSDEIAMFVSPLDVRTMRRTLPQNLALLLYVCMQQVAMFLEDAEDALSDGGSGRRRIVDDCAVRNAVRIIARAMPYALELEVCEPHEDKSDPKFPFPPLPESPAAHDFPSAFFWRNDRCAPAEDRARPFPPVLRTSRAIEAGGQGRQVPLGEELIVMLTRLLFVPTWTIDKAVTMLRQPIDMTTEERRGHGVVPEYLLCPGLMKEAVTDGALFFAQEVKLRRYEVLRCVLACLTTPVAVGRSLAPNPFLDVLVDKERNELSTTLCCSLVNYVAQYVSRGVAPYSSHFWADLPEAFLADALQLLALCIPPPAPASAVSDAARRTWASETNSFLRFLNSMASDAKLANFLALGLYRVIENPLFAATTTLRGSQRRIQCVSEALNLALRLASAPEGCSAGWLAAFVGMGDALLFPLLFFLQLVKSGRPFFTDAQCALYVVLKLSAQPAMLDKLGAPFPGVMPFSDLPPVDAGATYGDVLALALCDVLSPGTPRWMQPLANAASAILANIAPHVDLQERQCFELFHVLDYVTSSAFASSGATPKAVDKDAVIINVVNACVAQATVRPFAALPLVAALATADIAGRVMAMVDPAAEPPAEDVGLSAAAASAGTANEQEGDAAEEPPAESTPPKRHMIAEERRDAVALAPLEQLTALARRVIGALPADDADPTGALKPHVEAAWAPATPTQPQDLAPTVALAQYVSSALWATVHAHNARPPIFDMQTSALFRVQRPKLPPAVVEALQREDAEARAAAEEAARQARQSSGAAAAAAAADEGPAKAPAQEA